jgi:Predicted ATP-binding protein involved in virulence
MRFVDRKQVPAPAVLTGPAIMRMREDYLKFLSLEPRQRAQTRPPDRHLPYDGELNVALSRLFNGKCAFCEGRARLFTYRFRPTSEALPFSKGDAEAHLTYGWLADVWQNLYPICTDCRPTPPNLFPVDGPRQKLPTLAEYTRFVAAQTADWPYPVTEKNLLLDPCVDRDIARHLAPSRDGTLVALSRRGAATIETFRLNRTDLVSRRAKAFERAVNETVVDGVTADELATEEFGGLIWQLLADPLTFQDGGPMIEKAAPPRKTPRPVRPKPAPAAELATDWQLTDVSIENFKSLEKLDIAMPPPPDGSDGYRKAALLILGENASGKSSILEALALALIDDEARERISAGGDFAVRRLLLDPRYMGDARKKARQTGSVRLGFTDASGKRRERRLHLSPAGFRVEGDALPGLPVFAYGAFRHFRDDYRRWTPERGVVNLFRSDNLLSKPDKWLLTLKEHEFDLVVGILREIFGAAGSFRVIERDAANNQCLVVAEQGDGVITRTPLYTVSSGFRTILALTCDILRWLTDRKRPWSFPTLTMATGIVLIDEVEAHLHPRWKVQVMAGLRRALPNLTFIATTHDPLCLRGMRDGEVMVLKRIPGTAADTELPIMVESLTELPNVSQLTIEQLLSSDFFDLFNTDDPRIGRAMAELADALAAVRAGRATDTEVALTLARYRREIDEALPVGRTEVSRLVQEAVADYVIERGRLGETGRRTLRAETRQRIVNILREA